MRSVLLLLFAASGVTAADLAITEVVLRESEDGAPVARATYQPGQTVFLSFRIKGFTSAGDDRDVHIAWSAETLDPSKRQVGAPKTEEVKVQLAPEDKEWTPRLRYEVQLPPAPEPGAWTIVISAEDKLAKRTARHETSFRLAGPALPAAGDLGILSFRFLRSESDRKGLADPVYPAGDTVWVRFNISGYKFGPQNRFDIRYGLALRDASGKVLFEEPKAATESEEGPYPKLYTGAMFSVNLAKDIEPGEYTLAITLTDSVANSSTTTEHKFRIEK